MHYRLGLTIGLFLSLAGLLGGSLPLGARGTIEELAWERSELTAHWLPVQGKGFFFRLPPGWTLLLPENGFLGIYSASIVAPLCDQTITTACLADPKQSPIALDISIERASNQSTPPGDNIREMVLAASLPQRDVLVRGNPALLFHDDGRWGYPSRTLLNLEHSEVYYNFWLNDAFFQRQSDQSLLDTLLGTLVLQPQTAPAPFDGPPPPTPTPPVDPAPTEQQPRVWLPTLIASGTPRRYTEPPISEVVSNEQAGVTTTDGVFYKPGIAVEYAMEYGPLPTNSDGCYIYSVDSSGNNPQCWDDATRSVKTDGAHFIECALNAGQLGEGLCSEGFNVWNKLYVMSQIIDLVVPLSNPPFQDPRMARPGDVFVAYNTNGTACNGGIVVETGVANISTIWIAAHSPVDGTRFEPASFCTGPDRIEFYRIITDTTPPSVEFTGPVQGRLPYGATINLTWIGDDGVDGSGIAGYTLRESVEGQPFTDLLVDSPETSRVFTLNTPCRAVTFQVTATDIAEHVSPPADRVFTVGLQGDLDQNDRIDSLDLSDLDQALGLVSDQSGYSASMDINADGRITMADRIWLSRHLGDQCPRPSLLSEPEVGE